MVYEFTHWKDKRLHDAKLEELFEAGREEELAFKAQLSALGRVSDPPFELVDSGSAMEAGSQAGMLAEKKIHGYLDTRIKWEGRRFLFEMKLMRESAFEAIRTGLDGVEDLRRSVFYRKYLKQGYIYMLGANEDVLVFALTNGRGAWKFVILPLDYEAAENLLKTAERVNAAVAANKLPERIPYEQSICGRCAFNHICIPDIKADARLKLIDNPRLSDFLEMRDKLKEKASQYAKVDKAIREFFEDVVEGVYTIGNFIVTRKRGERLQIDPEKKQEAMEKFGVKVPTFRNEYERYSEPDPESIYLEPRRFVSIDEE